MTGDDTQALVLEARSDEVHVWRAALVAPAERVPALRGLLSEDERRRMDRFHFDRHRVRFCVGRATLRRLLGGYLGQPPESVSLSYGAQGKPGLDRTAPALADVRFNVSHSADQALFAVSLGREIGVDIERVKPGIEFAKIAERFFAKGEVRRLFDLPADQRPGCFFECWTRKESYLKACGGGLQLPLRDFEVTFGPGIPAKLLSVKWDASEVGRWSLAALEVADGFRGAITVEGRGWQLRYRDATEPGLI